ncbi:Nudix hydrolase [Pirellula sp. SH-Sr6A]|uniref:NUDIX hydrolase n=1 Tax=Pirellula sp. SH-Sr6A TaxID=1632865 RepID=UPI00078D365C|nr:NUDIX hydrolase [Pirellula sp. SH-Sr6A]AMV33959.1 Nudix hydrolase [Pirellula sp. SH-Sr6A]
MSGPDSSIRDQGRHGVVAVIQEESRLLVIRRSALVRAPNLLCFPGGGIEPGESIAEAMRREMLEELQLPIHIERHLWSSVTRWGTHLEWLLCHRAEQSEPVPNPDEVSEVMWLTQNEILVRDDLLGSLPDFFQALENKQFEL